MPRYRLSYGDVHEFDAQGAGEGVPVMQSRRRSSENEIAFMRRAAMEMCEWNGRNYYFHSREAFAGSMISHGLLECVD